MSRITDILVHYPILCSVAKHLTTLELLHLASASKLTAKACQLGHSSFDDLKRYTVCDSSGALARSIWNCCLLDSPFENPGNTTFEKLAALVRAEVDDISCSQLFFGNFSDGSVRKRCLQVDMHPCSKCKIMICEVSDCVILLDWGKQN